MPIDDFDSDSHFALWPARLVNYSFVALRFFIYQVIQHDLALFMRISMTNYETSFDTCSNGVSGTVAWLFWIIICGIEVTLRHFFPKYIRNMCTSNLCELCSVIKWFAYCI